MMRTYLPLVLFATCAVACGSAERPAPRDSMSIDSHMASASTPSEDTTVADDEEAALATVREDILESGSCELDGEASDCKVYLPTMNGTNNCFVGTQVCNEGEWTPCMSDDDAVGLLAASNSQ